MKKIATILIIIPLLLLLQNCKENSKVDLPSFKAIDLVPSYVQVDSLVKFNLKNKRYIDYIVFGTAKNNDDKNKFIGIYSYDSLDNVWKQMYTELFYATPTIDTGYISSLDRKLLIISTSEGSGGYLSYKVLGYFYDSIKIFLKRDGISQGSIYFLGDQIIEEEGQKSIAFIFNGEAFVGISLIATPYKPLDLNDVMIEYSIDDFDNIYSTKNIKIKQGQKLYLVRIGDGPGERIFYPSNILEKYHGYYYTKNIGVGSFTIIPSGYNSEKSKDIVVEVYK